MGLNQEQTGKLLGRAQTTAEVEEVLTGYVTAKFNSGGNAAQVSRKLHLLTLYLRAVNLGYLLRDHYEAFTVTAYAVKTAPPTSKGGLPGAAAVPRTALGVEAFNAARRPSKSIFNRVYSSRSLSSSASSSSSNLSSAAPSAYNSDAEDDDTVRPAQGRSRSSTSTSLLVGDAAIEAQERLRAAAGAGGNRGLGRGLLSAPPVYDGGVADYIASLPVAPRSGRPSFEDEALPGY
ncbi:hypothetical protein BCR35DRAFT_310147 [Leucosporidium creatinivorum]|uniref:Uncharacterized protein n=1 Tax=Leucosporidium creatinivorum TaxID=106004 RepID=A0A1Y2D7M4_9BASI|nr:hypothetical protein BCR35DRAFT_310147 [Leucosporidium creatinivorum]